MLLLFLLSLSRPFPLSPFHHPLLSLLLFFFHIVIIFFAFCFIFILLQLPKLLPSNPVALRYTFMQHHRLGTHSGTICQSYVLSSWDRPSLYIYHPSVEASCDQSLLPTILPPISGSIIIVLLFLISSPSSPFSFSYFPPVWQRFLFVLMP